MLPLLPPPVLPLPVFLAQQVQATPGDYSPPAGQVITIGAVFAHYDGTGAAGSYVPTLDIVSDAGKTILRDYIKATVGFEKLGEATGTQPKSLIRMFGPRGNPQAKNLFSVISYLQKRAGLQLQVTRAA